MKFATAKVLIGLTVIWAIACFALDYIKRPRPFTEMIGMPHEQPKRSDEKAMFHVDFPRLCSATCEEDLKTALKPVPGVKLLDISDPPKVDPSQPRDCSREATLEVTDMATADIMQIDRALRNSGLAADRIIVSGLHHYRFEAAVGGCANCDGMLAKGLDISRGLKSMGHFKWLDSMAVESDKLVVAYVKFDEPSDAIEIIAALNQLGVQPFSLVVKNEPEHGASATPPPSSP